MRRSLLLFSLLVPAVAAAVACASIYGVTDVPTPVDASRTDASSDALASHDGPLDAGADSDDSSSCPSMGWPAKSDAAVDGATDLDGAIVLAAMSIDLTPTDPIGFNLDGVCTCPGPPSCNSPGGVACDDPMGVDRSLDHVLYAFGQLFCIPFVPAVEKGYSDILLRISGYNGQANDDQVAVEVFGSVGTSPDDAGRPTPPRNDGTDVWQLDQAGIMGSPPNETSRYVDFKAYVTDHVLVAHPSDGSGLAALLWRLDPSLCGSGRPSIVGASPLVILGTGAVVTGTLTQDAGVWTLENGQTGARVGTDGPTGLLASLERFGLCPKTTGAYEGAVSFVCPARDIMSAIKLDDTDASCDSVSFAIGFTGVPAQLGPAINVPIGSLCGATAPACGDQ